MTRRIDRAHELARAEAAAKAERPLFEARIRDVAATEADRLHAALGLPAGLRITFGSDPVAANDAANLASEASDRA